MKYAQLVAHFGGPTKAAKALGIQDRRRVHAWSTRRIPAKWQVKVEVITDGKLRADSAAKREVVEMARLAKDLRVA